MKTAHLLAVCRGVFCFSALALFLGAGCLIVLSSPAFADPAASGPASYKGFTVGDAVDVMDSGKRYPAWVVQVDPSGGMLFSVKVYYAAPGPHPSGELDDREQWTGPGLLTHASGRGPMPARMAPRATGTAPGFAAGDAVDVIFGGLWYPATLLEIKPSGGELASVHVHYTDRSPSPTMHDQWIGPTSIRHSKGASAIATGPRQGRYEIYTFGGKSRLYLGYFILTANGYQNYSVGKRLIGEGGYSYDAASHTIHWKGGPLAEYAPTADFSNALDGPSQQIRLGSNTVAISSAN